MYSLLIGGESFADHSNPRDFGCMARRSGESHDAMCSGSIEVNGLEDDGYRREVVLLCVAVGSHNVVDVKQSYWDIVQTQHSPALGVVHVDIAF